MRGQCRIFSTVGLGSACVCEDLSSRVQKTEGRAVETEFQAHGHCWGRQEIRRQNPRRGLMELGKKTFFNSHHTCKVQSAHSVIICFYFALVTFDLHQGKMGCSLRGWKLLASRGHTGKDKQTLAVYFSSVSCSWIALTFHSDGCRGVQVTTENWKLLDHSTFLCLKTPGTGVLPAECGPGEQKPPPEWTVIAGSMGTHLYLLGAPEISLELCYSAEQNPAAKSFFYHSLTKTSTELGILFFSDLLH